MLRSPSGNAPAGTRGRERTWSTGFGPLLMLLLSLPCGAQVVNKQIEVVTHLARCAAAFGKRDAYLALGGLVAAWQSRIIRR